MIEQNILDQMAQIQSMGNKPEFIIMSVNAYKCLCESLLENPRTMFDLSIVLNPFCSEDVVVLSDCITELEVWES